MIFYSLKESDHKFLDPNPDIRLLKISLKFIYNLVDTQADKQTDTAAKK